MKGSVHRRRTALALAGVIVALTAAVAMAASTNKYTVTGKIAATKAGTKSKPAPTSGDFVYDVAGPNGERPDVITKVRFGWSGIKIDGADFPKCTAAMIDAKQSDSDCPKGSLMATGNAIALAGPPSNKMSSFTCKTSAKAYNGGADKQTVWLIPDPANCAGVQYLAPFEGTISSASGGGSEVSITFPENVIAPLPGIDGAATHFELHFRSATSTIKVRKKVHGKKKKVKVKVGYLEGVSCPGKSRTFSMTSTDTGGEQTATASAGSCG